MAWSSPELVFLALLTREYTSVCRQLSTSRQICSPRYCQRLPAALSESQKLIAWASRTSFFRHLSIPVEYRNHFLGCRRLGYPDGSDSPSIRPSMLANSRRLRWLSASNNQIIAGMLNQPPAGLHQPLLQARQGPVPELEDARAKLERWRQDYNQVRPHGALGDQAPALYAEGWPEFAPLFSEPTPRTKTTGKRCQWRELLT